jgi:hypothetical protein
MNKTALLICCNDKVEAVVIADNEELVKPRLEELARSHFETLSWQHADYRDYRRTYFWHIHTAPLEVIA